MKARGLLKEYKIIGRRLPSEKLKKPPLFQMRIFAPDEVSAKSRFWFFLRRLKKLKKSHGEVVACDVVRDKKPTRIKNFGIWLRYESRSGTHNMYREYRDLTVAGAVTQSYRDMAARHRARAHSIQIIKVQSVAPKQCRRTHTLQFINSKIRFPVPHRINRQLNKPRFTTRRPHTFF
jgi:large subunit ribosomal protein L18Ae